MATLKKTSTSGVSKSTLVQNMTESIRDSQKNQVTSRYSITLNGKPTFVTYYAQDALKSTVDGNLGGTVEYVGNESGIRYNEIHDFPVYNMPVYQLDNQVDEEGRLVQEITGEVDILPNTIVPKVEDVFILEEIRDIAYAKITKVTPSHLSGKTYFRIGFIFISHTFDISKQVEESYDTDFDAIGVEGSPIFLKKSLHATREHFEIIVGYVSDMYKSRFFDSNTSMYRLMPAGSDSMRYTDPYPVFDHVVGKFIDDNKLFKRNKQYFSAVAFAYQEADYSTALAEINSPYKALLGQKNDFAKVGNYLIYRLNKPNEGDTLFYTLCGKPFYQPERFVNDLPLSLIDDHVPGKAYVQLFPDGFLESIGDETVKDFDVAQLSPIQNIIANYFKGLYSNPDVSVSTNIESFLSDLNNSSMYNDSLSFWLVPILLLIANALKQEIDKAL